MRTRRPVEPPEASPQPLRTSSSPSSSFHPQAARVDGASLEPILSAAFAGLAFAATGAGC
jgi:hypothetical protein